MVVGIARIGAATLIVGLLATRPLADGPAPRRFEIVETHMGSPFQIVLYTDDEAVASRASAAAFRRIAELDAALSDYDPESELSRLCARSGGPPVAVGADLFDVLERSLDLARRSGGAFDPTIGPVGRLWRRARRNHRMPEADALERARASVGFESVRLDPEHRTVQLRIAGMKLDLGGIAKGYASAEALEVLAGLGIRSALVAGAGDIAVGDPPPGAEGWTIGIAQLDVDPTGSTPGRSILLSRASISTSGDAERFVELDGVRYSHIVDPRTGLGLTERSSVTIVAPAGAGADGLATAVSVLGPTRGLALIEESAGAAALIVHAGPSGVEVIESPRWAEIHAIAPKKGRRSGPADPAEG